MYKFLSSGCITFGQCIKCEVFEYKKSKCKAIHDKTQIDVAHEESICNNNLFPGSSLSVDHFKSQLKGQNYIYFGNRTS